MGITPLRYIKDVARALPRPHSLRPHNNWMALSPLAVFLAVYLVSSIVAGDFYKVPVVSAFIIAAIYAISISHGGGSLERRVATFSEGAGNKNVLLMIWIFVLAGAFASTAKQIGAIDATVNLTTSICPSKSALSDCIPWEWRTLTTISSSSLLTRLRNFSARSGTRPAASSAK